MKNQVMKVFMSWPHKVQRRIVSLDRIRISRSGRIEIVKLSHSSIHSVLIGRFTATVQARSTKWRAIAFAGITFVLLLAGLVAVIDTGERPFANHVLQIPELNAKYTESQTRNSQKAGTSSGTIVETPRCASLEQGIFLSKEVVQVNFKVSEKYGGFLVAYAESECFKGRKLMLKTKRDGFVIEKLIPQPSDSVAGSANRY
jgi:hypothetical protein